MERATFDAFLIAYRLPRMMGFRLARDVKRRSPGTPVILISGYTLLAPEELTYVDAYIGRDSGHLANQNTGAYR